MEFESSSMNETVVTYIKTPTVRQRYDVNYFLSRASHHVIKKLNSIPRYRLEGIKCQLSLHVQLKKFEYDSLTNEESLRIIDPVFVSETRVYHSSVGDSSIDEACSEINRHLEGFIHLGSGWTLDKILLLRLKVIKFRVLSGGKGTCKLPPELLRKRACLNISCRDDKCFLYCCVAAIHKVHYNPARVNQYKKYEHQFKTSNVSFPMTLNKLPKFEKDNPGLSINVLQYEGFVTVPVYHTKNERPNVHCINLLLYKSHFYLIRHLSRLLHHQSTSNKRKWYYCHYCLCKYKSDKLLDEHKQLCRQKLQKYAVPTSNPHIRFQNFKALFWIPFVIYYDIETMISKCEKTQKEIHVPVSVCCYRHSYNSRFSLKPVIFTGIQCMTQFLNHLKEEDENISQILDIVYEPIMLNEHDKKRIRLTQQCEVCGVHFNGKKNPKYKDHYHLGLTETSNLRFVLCNRCNLTYGRTQYRLPVVAHNATNYDLHLIVQNLTKDMKVKVLSKNTEKFLSMTLGNNLVFLDSLNFINGSLASLTKDLLTKNDNNLSVFLQFLTSNKDKQILLHRKGVFPYEWLTDINLLKQRSLPDKTTFFDRLSQTEISDDDYNHANKVWSLFNCKTMKDYLELYLKLDVMLLAAVVESYRQTTYDHFKIDALHYVSSPSLCFDAMLKITGIQLETLPSVDMYLWFHKSIRGGFSGTSLRYAKANNPLCKDYDCHQPISHIIGFDANQLYGHSMSCSLPYSGFRWLTTHEINSLDINSIAPDSPIGYHLEVDLDYPNKLHKLHCNFPLCPEKISIQPSDWTEYMIKACESLKMKKKSGGEKLMTTLYDKKHYILHYRALQFYLRLGLILVKIHRCVQYNQKPFMKTYIDLNIKERKKATSSFDVALYKLYNNCVFGKCMYNVFKQTNYKLVHSESLFKKLACKPTFKSCQPISENLIGVQMKPATLLLGKPIYIGTSILDYSKIHMQSFYYDYLVPMYSEKGLSLLYTDTDSFYVYIENQPQLYNDILWNKHYFDRSNYPTDNPMYSDENKRKVGLMKDIHADEIISELCSLRAKMYAIKLDTGKEDLKAKGLQKSVIAGLYMDTYKSCLQNLTKTKHTFYHIRSYKHQVETKKQVKIGLSAWCDKRRYICAVHSVPHGYYDLSEICSICSCDKVHYTSSDNS